MEKHILSKSTYIKGEQCLKQLYLSKKRPFLRDRMPAERLAVFSRGTNVGIYAQQLFPGGIDAGPKHPSQYRKAVETTTKLVANGQEVIYEAGVQAHKTLILLDILVKNGDAWDAYEVKSSKALSETYYKDAALQYYVLTQAGIKINSFSLIHIDKDYEREEEIDIHKLFITTDVTEEVQKRQEQVQQKIEEEIATLEAEHSPKIEIGSHCFSPYDCDFIGHCWKKIKSPSVFDIPSIDKEEQFRLFGENTSLENLMEEGVLSEQQHREVSTQLGGKEYLANDFQLMEKLKDSEKETFALKILCFSPALPKYPNTKPYQNLAFAFSIMPINGNQNNIELFIAQGNENPEKEVMEQLKKRSFGKTWLTYNNCKEINQVDLHELCTDGSFYHPAMNKDYSNKSLSKALGIKPPWKGIESDVVAAQYYDEILRNHKDSEEKHAKIKAYLKREVLLVQKFMKKLL